MWCYKYIKKKIQQVNISKNLFNILKDKYPERLKKIRSIYHFKKQKNDSYPFNILNDISRNSNYKLPFKLYYGILIQDFSSLSHSGNLEITYKGTTYTSSEMYHGLQYFFRPFYKNIPVCIYFSHKRADHPSSMAEILQYGPIIPINYSILEIEKIIGENYNNINDSSLVFYANSKTIRRNLDVINSEDLPEPKLDCIPCIKGCHNIDLSNIKSYYGFIFHIAIALENYKNRKNGQHLNILDHLINSQNVIDTYKSINKKSERCPVSKYKEETFFNKLNGGKKRKKKTIRKNLKNKKNIKTKRKTKKYAKKK